MGNHLNQSLWLASRKTESNNQIIIITLFYGRCHFYLPAWVNCSRMLGQSDFVEPNRNVFTILHPILMFWVRCGALPHFCGCSYKGVFTPDLGTSLLPKPFVYGCVYLLLGRSLGPEYVHKALPQLCSGPSNDDAKWESGRWRYGGSASSFQPS